MKRFQQVAVAVLIAAVTFSFIDDLDARRGGGFGGGRGFTSSKTSGWGSKTKTPTRSSNWGKSSSKKPPATKSTWSGNRTSTSTSRTAAVKPKRSAADQKAFEKAKSSGTAFKSKPEATKAFTSANKAKYPAKYPTKPTTRPAHIPQTTSAGGVTHNVTYNQQYGGYGYMGPSGAWIMYDAMADAAMLSMLMSRNSYYYDRPVATTGPVMVHRTRWSPLAWVGTIVVVLFLVVVIIVAMRSP